MFVFEERGKPEYPEKNLSGQRRKPTTNSNHIWRRRRDLNPGHIGGRRALSPPRHSCSPCVIVVFSPQKLVHLFLLKEVDPFPDCNIIKFLTFNNLFSHYDIVAKHVVEWRTVSITFSHQSDAGSRTRAYWYWENLVSVVFLVLEFNALYYWARLSLQPWVSRCALGTPHPTTGYLQPK